MHVRPQNIPGGTGNVADDNPLFPQNAVEQGGFAHVGAAAQDHFQSASGDAGAALVNGGAQGLDQLVQSIAAALGMLSLGFNGAYVRFFTRFSVAGDKEGMASLNGMFMAVFLGMLTLSVWKR